MAEKKIILYDAKGRELDFSQKSLGGDRNFFHQFTSGQSLSQGDIENQPYKYHPVIYALCMAVMKNISRLPFELYYKEKESESIIDHEVLDVLRKPNSLMTRTNFIQAIILALFLPPGNMGSLGKKKGGQSFLIPSSSDYTSKEDSVDLVRGQIPTTIIPLNDAFISPATNKSQENGMERLIGWWFQSPAHPASKRLYLTNELIKITQFNPYNWLEGIANFQPAQIALLQDVKSDLFNMNLFDNNAIPTGTLKTDKTLSPEQRKDYLNNWNETMGGNNAQRTAILERGLEYDHIGWSMADMQYQVMKEYLLKEMTAVWGLNKIALGQYENINRATLVEGRKMLWNDTYLPLAELIIEALNTQWIQYVSPGLRLRFDTSKIQALRPDYMGRAKSGGEMVTKMFFSPALSAKLNGIPLSEEDIQTNPWLLENPALLKKMGMPTKILNGNEAEDEDEDEDKKQFITMYSQNKQIVLKEKPDKVEIEQDFLFWKNYVKTVLDPGEKRLKDDFISFFLSQRNEMQDKVDVWLKRQKELKINVPIRQAMSISSISDFNKQIEQFYKDSKPKASDFMLNKKEENEKLLKMYKKNVKPIMKSVENQLEEELGELIEFNVTNDMVDSFVKKRKKDLFNINGTTFDAVKDKVTKVIDKGITDHWTPQEMAKEIKKTIGAIGEIRKNQSKTIARTEMGIINGTTRYSAFDKEGIEHHKWVSAGDEAVRAHHRLKPQGDGQTVIKVGAIFPVTGLKFPLDPETNNLKEIINCRCVAIAVLKQKES